MSGSAPMTPWDRLRRCADLLERSAGEGTQEAFDDMTEAMLNLSPVMQAVSAVIADGIAHGMKPSRRHPWLPKEEQPC